jgi:predicted nucleotidyltransferase
MVLSNVIAEKRERILNVAAKYGARDVRIFGSVARGDAGEQSDVDILVKLDSSSLKGMRYFGVLEQLQEELEEVLHCPVDVVDELGLKDPLPDDVLKEAVSL